MKQSPTTSLSLKSINPKLHNKFSPNLYKYLRKRGALHLQRVYTDIDGLYWLGYFDDHQFFNGVQLMHALTKGAKAQSWSHPPKTIKQPKEVEDFWQRYQSIGRCAIDTEHTTHFISGKRWSQTENSRTCLWCGHQQILKKWTETIERTDWVNASSNDSVA